MEKDGGRKKLGVARTDVTRVVGMFLVSVSVTSEIPRFADMWKPRFHENESLREERLPGSHRPDFSAQKLLLRGGRQLLRNGPIRSCHPRHRTPRNENMTRTCVHL